ncbi:7912_t:CDS:1, partial [Funneliformis caledonium]
FAALFTALLTASCNCTIKVHTDSSVIIFQFNKYKFLSQQSLTFRPFLKINNFMHWSCLFELITTNNLNVSLIKVKAHADSFFNNKVNALAKAALESYIL